MKQMKHIKLFESFINEEWGKPEPNYKHWKIGKLKFKSMPKDYPDEDILIAQVDKNFSVGYSIYVKTFERPGNLPNIEAGTEYFYIIGGSSYVKGADEDMKNVYDGYKVNEIPKEYMPFFKELKSIYEKKYR